MKTKSIYKPRNIARVSRIVLLCSELLLPVTYWLFLKGPYIQHSSPLLTRTYTIIVKPSAFNVD